MAPRWSWSSSRWPGSSRSANRAVVLDRGTVAYDGEPAGAGAAMEALMARREQAAASAVSRTDEEIDASERRSIHDGGKQHARAGHCGRGADDVRQARRGAGQLASGRPVGLRPHLADRAHRGRPRAHRRCRRWLRHPVGGAEHQRDPQRVGVGRAAPERAGHHGRPPVRFVPAGRALRRRQRGRRPLRPGGGLRRRSDEPGPHGVQCPRRHRPVPAFIH